MSTVVCANTRGGARCIDLIDIAATRAPQMLCIPGTLSKHSGEIIPHYPFFEPSLFIRCFVWSSFKNIDIDELFSSFFLINFHKVLPSL